MSRVRALIWKDLKIFFSDRKALLITFIVPIGIASFFGMVFGNVSGGDGAPKKIPILVVDGDGSPLVQKIVDGLKKNSLTDPTIVSQPEADKSVKEGHVAVAVVFPKGFGKDAPQAMFQGQAPEVELRYDPSKSMEMQAVQGSIMQVAMQTVSKEAFSAQTDYASQISKIDTSSRLSPDQKAQFHDFFSSLKKINSLKVGSDPESSSGSGVRVPFTIKGVAQTAAQGNDADKKSGLSHTFAGMAMQGVMFFGINAAMALLADRRKGIWRRLRASPVHLSELLVGKALANALIGAFVLVGVLAFGMAVFGMRVAGSWLGLGAVLAAAALMTSAFGLVVASLGRTEEQSRGLSILAVLTMSMLGGAWFPSSLMPTWVQKLSFAVPVRWALDGFDAMLWRGQGFDAVLAPVGGLLCFAALFGAIAAFRFKTMPETA